MKRLYSDEVANTVKSATLNYLGAYLNAIPEDCWPKFPTSPESLMAAITESVHRMPRGNNVTWVFGQMRDAVGAKLRGP